MKTLSYIVYRLGRRIFNFFRHTIPNRLQANSLKHFGKDSSLGNYVRIFGHENISIGDHTNIGYGNILYATDAPLTIGNGVMLATNITIVTGNHRTDVLGEYMYRIGADQKKEENDAPVVIEDDVWIGAGAILLKGTTIGHGSIIHAGAVVSGNVPPYSIYYSRDVIKPRFTPEQIVEHEKLLKEKYGSIYGKK